MQDVFKINGITVAQPDEDLSYSWETTYTDDSTRTQTGAGHFTRMFTVESYTYKASALTASEAAQIMQQIVYGRSYTAHVFSPRLNCWCDIPCYTGKGSMSCKTWVSGGERFADLTFNMIGVNPI